MEIFSDVKDSGFIGVITAPLEETPIIPDSILIYGNGTQVTYIIQALCYENKEEYEVVSKFVGGGESCLKGGFRPFFYNKAEFVLPGRGDRSFCAIHPSEVAIGMPAKHIFYVLDNLLEDGSGQGLKFPLRTLIPRLSEKVTPGYMYMREVIDKKLRENDQKEG